MTATNSQANTIEETKNKRFNLSIADFIAIALSLITFGVTIGYVKSSLEGVADIKNDIKELNGAFNQLKVDCAKDHEAITILQPQVNFLMQHPK